MWYVRVHERTTRIKQSHPKKKKRRGRRRRKNWKEPKKKIEMAENTLREIEDQVRDKQ